MQNQGLTLRDQTSSHSQSPGTVQGHGDSPECHWLRVHPGPVSLTETNESCKENIPYILHCFPLVPELQVPSFPWQRVNGNSDAQGRCSGAVKVTGSSGPFLASSQLLPFSMLDPEVAFPLGWCGTHEIHTISLWAALSMSGCSADAVCPGVTLGGEEQWNMNTFLGAGVQARGVVWNLLKQIQWDTHISA